MPYSTIATTRSLSIASAARRRGHDHVAGQLITACASILAVLPASADLVDPVILVDTPTLHIATLNYTTPRIFNFEEIITGNWSWRLVENDIDADFSIDDFSIEAFHLAGPHGEPVPNGPLGGVLLDVPPPGTGAVGSFTDFKLHGAHVDSLELSFFPLAPELTQLTIVLEHNVPAPGVALLLIPAGIAASVRRR